MTHTDLSREANDQYQKLIEYADHRSREISAMLTPYKEVTERYGALLCRISLHLAKREPASIQDAVIRDLMADVFDFLFESRHFIFKGQPLLAFPLARRAYESLSLMHWCVCDSEAAEAWHGGKRFNNTEVRSALSAQPMGETEERLRDLYNFFCRTTHPNREMIPFRGLGEGNRFVFGSIGMPNLIELVDYCIKHLEMWFWFCPVAVWHYKEIIFPNDFTFQDDHNSIRDEAQSVTKWLVDQYNHLLEEYRNDSSVVTPKYT